MNDLTVSEKIKLIMSRKGITQAWVADRMGISSPALTKKFKANDWREKDLRLICEILGTEYAITFKSDGEWI